MIVIGPDGEPLQSCPTAPASRAMLPEVGAIPFCLEHGEDWQEDCRRCEGGQSVKAMVAEHVTLYPGCEMWPLCSCEEG